jgi:hypothetical protein
MGDPDLLKRPNFILRGGCTLLITPETREVRCCIFKRIQSAHRLDRMRDFLGAPGQPSLRSTYFGDPRQLYNALLVDEAEGTGVSRMRMKASEPLAMLHRSLDEEEVT